MIHNFNGNFRIAMMDMETRNLIVLSTGSQDESHSAAHSALGESALSRFFKLRMHGTTVRIELTAGVTTFVTMAYIIVVNPAILGEAGIPEQDVFFATCVSAAIATLVMGIWATSSTMPRTCPVACATA